MPAYPWIIRVLNMSEFCICHCTNYRAVIETEAYSEHCQTSKMECFAKRHNDWVQMHNQNFFRTWMGVVGVELGHFDKHFFPNRRKRGPAEKHFGVFLLDFFLKTTFWMEHLTQRWTQWGSFFPKSEHFFWFLKKAGEASPLPLASRL